MHHRTRCSPPRTRLRASEGFGPPFEGPIQTSRLKYTRLSSLRAHTRNVPSCSAPPNRRRLRRSSSPKPNGQITEGARPSVSSSRAIFRGAVLSCIPPRIGHRESLRLQSEATLEGNAAMSPRPASFPAGNGLFPALLEFRKRGTFHPRSPDVCKRGNVSFPLLQIPRSRGTSPSLWGMAHSPWERRIPHSPGLLQAGNASFPVLRISAREGTSHSLSSKSRAPGERRGSSGEWPWRDALSPCRHAAYTVAANQKVAYNDFLTRRCQR